MNNNCSRTLLLAMTCLLCVAGYAGAGERASSDARSSTGTARLIVYRIPNIGTHVIAQLYVDDAFVGAIGYGQTYEGVLTPGQHALSALVTPRPKWWERPPTIVDVRPGGTYRFTAMGNGSGNLILWNDEDTRPPPREGVFPRPADTAAR